MRISDWSSDVCSSDLLAGIREILIITTPQDQASFQRLLGDGSAWGLDIAYAVQPDPGGLAQAYLIGADFVGGKPSALVLGDNIFYGHGFPELLASADARDTGATVFGYAVVDPKAYGVVSFDADGRAAAIEEKPERPKSNYAVTGLYFYDGKAADYAAGLQPAPRGALEINNLHSCKLVAGPLHVELMGGGLGW